MSAGFALIAGGAPAGDIVARMSALEVEENADAPGAIALTLPLSATDGELSWVGDARLQPLSGLAVVARGRDDKDQCVFDGHVLSHTLSAGPGLVEGTLRVWGQDASWAMNRDEKLREWADVTDGGAASAIFGEHGITPGPGILDDDSPLHGEAGHTLIQRGTDAQFLRRLARRSGKLFRVTNLAAHDARIGIFARPRLDGTPVATLNATDIATANVDWLDLSWDVMRATQARGGQALLSASDPASAAENEGLTALEARTLADFAGQPSTALTGAVIDDAAELTLRAQGALIDGGFFVTVRGTTDVARLGTVLRVGDLVTLAALGSVHSGKYYVWSVRHSLTLDRHEMRFELVRNAVGPAPTGGGLLSGVGL